MIEWKDIPGYLGFYKISNTGIVKSCKRIVNHDCRIDGRIRAMKGRVIKQHKNAKGYYGVHLSKDGNVKGFSVHRIMVDAFLGGLPKGMNTDHVDGNKENNNLSNLEIVTPSENNKRAYALGLNYYVHVDQKKGSDHPNAQKVEAFNFKTKESLGIYGSIEEGCRALGCRSGNVSLVVQGKRHHTMGLGWKKVV